MSESQQEFSGKIRSLLGELKRHANKFEVVVVCNRKSSPPPRVDFPFHSMTSEFLSDYELSQILHSLRSFGLYVRAVFSDAEFYENSLLEGRKRCVIFNLDPSSIGTSGKLLTAAVAQARRVVMTSSSPYAIGLARNKFHWSIILSFLGIPTPGIWCYSQPAGWVGNREPPLGIEVLLQPVATSASIGVDSRSKLIVDDKISQRAQSIATSFQQDVIARQFIPGFEVECPVITFNRAYALPPIGLTLNGERNLGSAYLDYDAVYSDAYGFYDFADVLPDQAIEIQRKAQRISELLGLRGLSRIDFRVSSSGESYVIDIAAYPHVVEHSAFARAVRSIGLTSEFLPSLMVALALYDADLLQPSDQC